MPRPIAFNSRHALAVRVQNYARQSFDVLTLLPHNRFVEDSEIWWLVPSHRSPAFSDTKFYFGRDFDQQGMIDVGIHAEKGFGEVVVPGGFQHAKGAGWIMDDRWHWHKFVKMVRSGRILATMEAASSAHSEPLFLRLHSYYVQSRPDNDAGSWSTSYDQAVYRLDARATELVLDREPAQPLNIPVRYPVDLDTDGLTVVLEKLNQQPWVWVDLFITMPFAPDNTAETRESTWDAYRLWDDYLRVFSFAVGSTYP